MGKRTFREGDKVIQTKNNYDKEVYNGDIGIIQTVTKEENDEGEKTDVMKVNFLGRIVTYNKESTKELDMAYAITIHKSQGGEAPIVIIPATTSHYVMLARNLMYTGMTRAREKLVFIGTQKVMHIAIQNDEITARNSRLADRLLNATNTFYKGVDEHV